MGCVVWAVRWCRWVLSAAMAVAGVTMALMPSTAPARSYEATNRSAALRGLGEVLPGTAVGPARREPASSISLTPSKTEPYWACPEGPCDAIVDPPPVTFKVSGRTRLALPDSKIALEGSGELGGYDPQDLKSAYDNPTTGGSNQTIALVDAYGYPTAEADLGKYRERYGLPPCTKANICFKKINESGEEGNYPARKTTEPKTSWETESALDIEMASAACPECHIMLAEATNATTANLVAAEETAARLGATEISNSWGSAKETCSEGECEKDAPAFEHPGVLITVSAGDRGYDNHLAGGDAPQWPAVLPSVVSVGGTSQHKAENARGWSEEAWYEPERPSGSGSGCAVSMPKPSWQTDSGCAGRTDNDVAAVAACKTPVSTYSAGHDGWANVCGTSVSAPLVAGIEAHASSYARSLPGADAFYHDPAALFDVTAGANGECTPPSEDAYLCHAAFGYDGPTGNGTPNGALTITGLPPSLATRPPTSVSASDATLNGKVDPQGSETTYRFEYGTTTSYGTDVPMPDGSLGSGVTDQAVSESLTGLAPETTYHYRLVATNAEAPSYGQDVTFTTESSTYETPPTVITGTADSSGLVSATLNASVNPNGVIVSECYFEYGTSPAYGSRAACASLPGSGVNAVPVSASVAGLSPATLYYFRIVAANATGMTDGNEQSLQTLAEELPELGRCIKLTQANSRYATSACTTLSTGGNTGEFEWQPWPLHASGFSSKAGAAKLETPGKAAVTCHESILKGEYTGRQLASVNLTLTGCEASGKSPVFEGGISGTCQSEGAAAGEITTGLLSASIGAIKAGTTKIGWDLKPAPGMDLAVFECEPSYPIYVEGSVIALVTGVDKMTKRFTLTYKAKEGKQAVQKVGTLLDVPAIRADAGAGERQEAAGFTLTSAIGNEESAEIKAIL